MTNQLFFNQLTQRVIDRVNHPEPAGRLYELDSRLRDTGEEGVWAMTIEDFLKRFGQGRAPLWQRLALCKARTVSGSRVLRQRLDDAIADVVRGTIWQREMATEILGMRQRMQQTAHPENLKRGEGGTVDVEFVAQMLTLRHAKESPDIIHCGTTASLTGLSEAGYLDETESLGLINGYRTLRRIESNLRLMNTPARHELPHDADSMRNLAFLMGESDPTMIVAQCQQARQNIRGIFNHIFDRVCAEN